MICIYNYVKYNIKIALYINICTKNITKILKKCNKFDTNIKNSCIYLNIMIKYNYNYEGGKNMKKLMKLLPVVLMVCLAFTSVFAIPLDGLNDINNGTAANNITNTARNVWKTVSDIILILAAAAIVFAGLKYMFASADQKADIKKSMLVLAIGALMVFGATAIIRLIASATSIIEQN